MQAVLIYLNKSSMEIVGWCFNAADTNWQIWVCFVIHFAVLKGKTTTRFYYLLWIYLSIFSLWMALLIERMKWHTSVLLLLLFLIPLFGSLLLFLSSFLFLFLNFLAYSAGSVNLFLILYAICCIFHCLENLPPNKLSQSYYYLFFYQDSVVARAELIWLYKRRT